MQMLVTSTQPITTMIHHKVQLNCPFDPHLASVEKPPAGVASPVRRFAWTILGYRGVEHKGVSWVQPGTFQ